MALSNEDILKIGKTINPIIRSEISNEVRSLKKTLSAEIKMSKIQILSTISELEDRIKNIEVGQDDNSKQLLLLQNQIAKLRKDLTKTISFFDKSNLSTREKVNKTRSELGLKEVAFAY